MKRYCVDVRVVECDDKSRAEKTVSSETIMSFPDADAAEGFAGRVTFHGNQLAKEYNQ